MGKSFAQSYVESLTKEVCDSYITKLKKLIISKCPFEDKEFVDEPITWPVVEYGDIYSYFVCTTSHYTNENMKAYKSLEAYNYFASGWVRDIFVKKLSTDSFLLKAKVNPSQRSPDKPHEAWVNTQNDGTVVNGHCTCMAG